MTPLSPWNAKGVKPFEVVNNVYGDAERRRRLSEPASSSWPPKFSGAISHRDRFRWVPFSGPTGAGELTLTCQRKLTGKARLVAWAYSGPKFHACG